MAGTYKKGERKIRPGAYSRYTTDDIAKMENIDGVVAVLFKSDFGPLYNPITITPEEGYADVFGTALTTDIIKNVIEGGAKKVIACRIGTEGAPGEVKLKASGVETEVLSISTKYVGAKEFAVSIRSKLADSTKKECIFYAGNREYEKYEFTAGGDEVKELCSAMVYSKSFVAKALSESESTLANVSLAAFTGGQNPTVTTVSYSDGFTAIEACDYNVICVDTEERAVHLLLTAYADRIYDAGSLVQVVLAEKKSVQLAERMEHAVAFDNERVCYVLNASGYCSGQYLEGYQIAARISGMLAGTPANVSLTRKVLSNFTELGETLTNTQIIQAEQNGCLVLAYKKSGQVIIDNAINTLINPNSDQDEGWKKLRRVKTRFELIRRANEAAEEKSGDVDNDQNGRLTIIAAMQVVGDAMIREGKLTYCNISESTEETADGSSTWFVLDVIDKESAEHIYLLYKFRYSTREE